MELRPRFRVERRRYGNTEIDVKIFEPDQSQDVHNSRYEFERPEPIDERRQKRALARLEHAKSAR